LKPTRKRKKPRRNEAFWSAAYKRQILVAGAGLAFAAAPLSYVGRLRRPRHEPAPLRGCAGSRVSCHAPKMKKPVPLGPALFILVAGARYVNYMQIEMEPFPLVA